VKSNVLFLTLKVFSATGGIEKVCRIAGKALNELSLKEGGKTRVFCMYDSQAVAVGNPYFPDVIFTGFNASKIQFVKKAVTEGRKADKVILSHINLLLVGWMIKVLNPKVKLLLLAHGIEVWEPLSLIKKKMLGKCDLILPVSGYTRNKMAALQGIPLSKFEVLNNCLDPFLTKINGFETPPDLYSRYGFTAGNKILFTLTRFSAGDRYKGYDRVLDALETLVIKYPTLRYLLAGKYDAAEKLRIEELIALKKLKPFVVFTGFLAEAELAAHFNLADIYVMPSTKEGFGIVFIEAMYYGKPVIAGNKDGSADALLHGQLGLLVDPDNSNEIKEAIEKILENPPDFVPDKIKLEANFSYEVYKERLGGVFGV
jgi:glycosyltransferase involved in cell wall biosynthesis